MRLNQKQVIEAIVNGDDFDNMDLSGNDLNGQDIYYTTFENANLSGVNFTGADLTGCSFQNANLRNANFTEANLSGVNLEGANLEGVIGLASKSQEMQEAQRILELLQQPSNQLNMDDWHTCETSHCLAGWCCPHLKNPGAEASRKMPTLARYFHEYNESKAFEALIRVANGEESIWN
jgi:hypothetical protein